MEDIILVWHSVDDPPTHSNPVLVLTEEGKYAIADYSIAMTSDLQNDWWLHHCTWDELQWDDKEDGKIAYWAELPDLRP